MLFRSNNDKSIARQPYSQRVFALLPVYNLQASTLKAKEKTYRKKEVRYVITLLLHSYYTFIPLLREHLPSFEQLLHDCMHVLLTEISELSKRTIHAADPAGRVYPLRAFLLAVTADGAEVAQLCMSGIQCPCCNISKRNLDRTDVPFQLRLVGKVDIFSTSFFSFHYYSIVILLFDLSNKSRIKWIML